MPWEWPDRRHVTVLAIDPGKSGALSWASDGGDLIEVEDMPVIDVRGNNKVSGAGLRLLMARRPVNMVVIEGVSAMPHRNADGTMARMGATSSIGFGYGAGLIEGVAIGLGLSVEIVAPNVWKRRAQVPADKGAVRLMAQRFWPDAAKQFARKRDDGRADSALLARWYAISRDKSG